MAEKQGFLTKEGAIVKSWKKRWMVLRGDSIMYSKNQSSTDLGTVLLTKDTKVVPSDYKKKNNLFEIQTPKRTFYMQAESAEERDSWVAAAQAVIDKLVAGIDPNQKDERVGLEDFELLKVVGKGSFGKVIQVVKKDTGKIYAMKVLNKKTIIERNEAEHTKSEKAILQKLAHPFLVNLNYAFQTPDKLYFVMDFVNGGELFFHLQQEERFDEPRIKFYAAEISLGLEYLHSNKILYRDLKPENILIRSSGHICLTDFGISKEFLESSDDRTATFCGTPEYLAPEVLAGKGYGTAVDMWSLGTLIYEMFTGLPPFYAQDVQQMYQKIMTEDLTVPEHCSAEAGSLLHDLLERDPEKRLTDYAKLKKHKFFVGIDWDKLLLLEVEPPYVPPVKDLVSTAMIDPSFTSEAVTLDDGAGVIDEQFQKNFQDFTFKKGA